MEKDSYPRFLKSDIYLNLLNDLQANSLKWLVSGWRELKDSIKCRRNVPIWLPGWTTWPFLGVSTGQEEQMTQNGLTWKLSRRRFEEAEARQKQGDRRRKKILWYCHKKQWSSVLESPSELRRRGNSSYAETVTKGYETDYSRL